MFSINKPRPYTKFNLVFDVESNLWNLNSDPVAEFDKAAYLWLRKENPNVRFAVIPDCAVIAFAPACENSDCRMLKVAVSYCAPGDIFSKKTGKYQALLKFDREEFVQLPLMDFWQDNGTASLKEFLRNTFNV